MQKISQSKGVNLVGISQNWKNLPTSALNITYETVYKLWTFLHILNGTDASRYSDSQNGTTFFSKKQLVGY